MNTEIQISIKQRIYLNFLLLACMFVLNSVVTILTLNNNKKLSAHLSSVADPSLQNLDDFKRLMLESKMYTTNWVYLRFNQQDKTLLQKLHDSDYPALRAKLVTLSSEWKYKNRVDSLKKIFTGFEQLLAAEKTTMLSLRNFKDYNDPVVKLSAEKAIEDQVIPGTAALMNSLGELHAFVVSIRATENRELEKASMNLRMFIIILATATIVTGFLLSIYMARAIIEPVQRIRHILDNLGQGIIQKIDHNENVNEIGMMVSAVNKLSEKLWAMATFAHETGLRNFDTPYKPLSDQDVLGRALIAMRDNIKVGDEKLNEVQHIAKLGSFERDLVTGEIYLSDEMFIIFEIDPISFDGSFQTISSLIHPGDREFFEKAVQRLITDRQPFAIECGLITKSGVTKSLFIQAGVELDPRGNVCRTLGIVQDVSERKQYQEKLEEEQRLLRLVIENIPYQVYLKDTHGRYMLCNLPVAINSGCTSQAQMISKTDFDFFPLEKAAECFNEEWDVMQSGIPFINREEQMTDRITGKLRWKLKTKFPLKNHSGDVIGLIGINREITDEKIAENELRHANKELSILFNSIDETFFSINMLEMQVIQISPTCEKLSGYKPSEFLASYELLSGMIYPGDRQLIEEEYALLKKGEQTSNQYRIVHKDNGVRWVETKITPTLNHQGMLTRIDGITRDITKRKTAELAFLDSQKQIQTIFDAALDAIILIDKEGRIVKWDSKSEMLFGWKEEEVLGMVLSETILLRQLHEVNSYSLDHLLNPPGGITPGRSMEIHAIGKTGNEFYISLNITPSVTQEKYRFICFIRDITSRKKAETELHNSEERYRQIVETAQEGIWMTDEDSNTTFVNKKMCEIIGYTPGEIIGKRIQCFMDAAVNKNDVTQVQEQRRLNETRDAQFVTKSGKAVWTSISTNPVFDDTGICKGVLAMVTDISKRKYDEELLQRSQASLELNVHELEQKNKELEQFAYVASHDLQEPLSTTISFVEIFSKQYSGKLDPRADKYLAYIVQASERMSVLIKDLLDFSRIGADKEIEKVDCNRLMRDVIADIHKSIQDSGAKISVECLPVLNGYPSELKQLFQNLVINAIKFSKKHIPPKIKISAKKIGDYWQFAVADNGIGIDAQYSERIFIIFQRLHTRNEYHGSGIGLSHCKKIVELHHGKIWVKSLPGAGSTFYFTIHSPKENLNESKIELHHAH